jgi:hypothetical protein
LFINFVEIEELELYNNQDQRGEKEGKEEKRVKFRLIGPLNKIYNIVVYIRGSTTCIAKFLELIGRRILLNNCIR